jgi:signal peptidase I
VLVRELNDLLTPMIDQLDAGVPAGSPDPSRPSQGGHTVPAPSARITRMRTLIPMLVVAVLAAGSTGCGAGTAGVGTERFTQGGGSMEPTVKAGQVITARRVGHGYRPRRGDIVLFHPGSRWAASSAPYLKRVVALGGETIACCDPAGKVTVDGRPLAEPYVADDAPLQTPPNPRYCRSRRFGPVTVPRDSVFVLGDNRLVSNDSRCLGPVPVTSVVAVMVG